jgi:hypothetical protein
MEYQITPFGHERVLHFIQDDKEACSLQPAAYSLQPTACSLQPKCLLIPKSIKNDQAMRCQDYFSVSIAGSNQMKRLILQI